MDQLCKSNTRNKAHGRISNVYHYYPNSLHPNERNSGNLAGCARIWAHSTEETITNTSEAVVMDDIHAGQC